MDGFDLGNIADGSEVPDDSDNDEQDAAKREVQRRWDEQYDKTVGSTAKKRTEENESNVGESRDAGGGARAGAATGGQVDLFAEMQALERGSTDDTPAMRRAMQKGLDAAARLGEERQSFVCRKCRATFTYVTSKGRTRVTIDGKTCVFCEHGVYRKPPKSAATAGGGGGGGQRSTSSARGARNARLAFNTRLRLNPPSSLSRTTNYLCTTK